MRARSNNTYDRRPRPRSIPRRRSRRPGLQKWVFNSSTQQWHLAYTLQNGLNLVEPYTVAGYPTGVNNGPGGTGGPWSPATDGLRA